MRLWTSPDPVSYPQALATMDREVEAIGQGRASELLWLLEHPPLYTAGTSARPEELLEPRFPVFRTGRGGRFTYHGPGQRVAYVLVDLQRRGRDVRGYVWRLEEWLIQSLAELGVEAHRRPGYIGIWVVGPDGREAKIAALGVRVRRWITSHGVALNVCPDLSHFAGIVPCGLAGDPVTSLEALGVDAGLADVDRALVRRFGEVFGVALEKAPVVLAPAREPGDEADLARRRHWA